MIRQGDVIYGHKYKHDTWGEHEMSEVYYLVISNDWVNDNLREITALPISPINEPPIESRRTHLVVNAGGQKYLVQCEDIQHLHDAGNYLQSISNADAHDMIRIRKRLGWMFGGVTSAKS